MTLDRDRGNADRDPVTCPWRGLAVMVSRMRHRRRFGFVAPYLSLGYADVWGKL